MNMHGHSRFRRLAPIGLVFAIIVLSPNLFACSGPGAPLESARNKAFGFIGYIACGLLASPIMWLRLRRLGVQAWTFFPLVLLGVHPAWWIGSMGDCGGTRRDATYLMGCVFLVLMVWETARGVVAHRKRERSPHWWGLAVSLLLAGSIAVVIALPWSWDPLPSEQYSISYARADAVLKAQERWHESNGVYARDFHSLQSLGGMKGRLDLQEDGTVRSDIGEFEFMLRLVSNGDDYVLLARPDNWPERGRWMQYLFEPDGKLWQKPDSGEWQTDDPLIDPKAAGWEFVSQWKLED